MATKKIKKEQHKKHQRMVYLRSVEEIPEFDSLEEEAAFWDTHSPVEILEQLEPVTLELSPQLQHKIERRYQEQLLALCLSPRQIKQLTKIAKEEGVSCLALVKRWIEAGLEQRTARRDA
jgi:hypothetical protein